MTETPPVIRSAVVIGASSGMGRAIALRLARNGWNVTAVARREDRLRALQAELATEGRALSFVAADAADRSASAAWLPTATATTGTIDLLVYATGTNLPQRALTVLTAEAWQNLIDVNLTGAFLATSAVLPVMRNHGGGLIVYLSSAAVQMPDVSGVAYQASKHGLTGLAHGTRIEEKAHGIRTTVLFPGLCDTEILQKRPVPTPADVLAKALNPDDVALAVLFLADLPPRAVVPEMQLLPSRL